ncbi:MULTISPECIES: histone-like nucleoid-structuring protein Lsr2 [Nocardia]|uniref:Lsr2 family protein n=1 Tax=Nocardia arthritidis TaxID=228602 RepID=A0A6G9YB85_9NOCA|nr:MULTISPECIES: Lsr2 family protein [Nocardia]QIS10489.1 Lsr2 family protein [Nocardia arthritidis]
MAKKVTVTMVDDFDGTSKADETVHFSIDGVAYEIDLSTKNAGKLRAALEPWADNARRTGRLKTKTRGAGKDFRSTVDRDQSLAIREWARKNGHKVSARGRISADVVAAYNNAQK